VAAFYITRTDLPQWVQMIAVLLGLAIAIGILYALVTVPAARRLRRRVAAVEAAAGDDPVFGREPVRAAAVSLYRAVYEALSAGDRSRLATLCDDNMLAYWEGRLDTYERDGWRYRAEVLKGPKVDYIGVMDRPGHDDDWVCLRVRGSLRHNLEDADGRRRSLPEIPGRRRVAVDEYWTLRRRDGRWIASGMDTYPVGNANRYLTEDFVGPQR
jgi:predicted lipid-binding transport protein (Tim44 family)